MKPCFESFAKRARFQDLVASVQHCDICPRLSQRTKVLSEANGNLDAKVLFVGEAPGRLGADRTGIPLYGDKTGDNFEKLLGNISWRREQVFITNAVLCNPRKENGTNGTPTGEEIANCSAYLEMVLSLVKPDVVVSLGATALKSVELICPHGINLRNGVAQAINWFGIKLFPLYHPAPRAMIHRSLTKQRSDFMRLAKIVDPESGLKEVARRHPRTRNYASSKHTSLREVARAFLELGGTMTYFKLTKLLYLFDWLALNRMGRTFASDIYLRQVDGPWPPKLDEALREMEPFEVRRYFARRLPMVSVGPSPRCDIHLEDEILQMVAEVYKRYGALSNSKIKTAVYLTKPMRYILKEEQEGKDLTNKAVLYKDKSSLELPESKSK